MVMNDSTVRRALKKAGFVAFVKPRKPLLRAVNIKKRLQWAEEHKDWTVDDWKRVIFSDETKVNRFGSDGKAYAWKTPGEQLNSPALLGKELAGLSMLVTIWTAAPI
ncbi:hypothetical protein G6F67_009367 [Rhizopus microsporus]|nr:hypothetical protein G6F67_009631 [Rhizopus microsporus]KAG1225173.1 hypothetical protein G6F67_009367 [Rhizopus microsporus]